MTHSEPSFDAETGQYHVPEICSWRFHEPITDWRPGTRIAFGSYAPWPFGFSVVVSIAAMPFLGGFVYQILSQLVPMGWPGYGTAALAGGAFVFRTMRGPREAVIFDWEQGTLRKRNLLGSQIVSLADITSIRLETVDVPSADPTDAPQCHVRVVARAGTESVVVLRTLTGENREELHADLRPAAEWLANALKVEFQSSSKEDSRTTQATSNAHQQTSAVDDHVPEQHAVAAASSKRPSETFDHYLYGIREWSPGTRVRINRKAMSIIGLFSEGAPVFLLIAFSAFVLIGVINEYVAEIPHLWRYVAWGLVTVVGCTVATKWIYRPGRDVVFDWGDKTIRIRIGQDSAQYSFDDIQELRMRGQYTPKSHQRYKGEIRYTTPANWSTTVSVTTRDGRRCDLVDGFRKYHEESDGSAADSAYLELLPMVESLAASLNVPWHWMGFAGHEKYQPLQGSASQSIPVASDVADKLDEPEALKDDINDERTVDDRVAAPVEINSDDVDSYLQAGRTFLANGDAEQAIDVLTLASLSFRDHAAVFRERAQAYELNQQHDKALADLSHAIELEPEEASAYERRAELLAAMGRYSAAIDDFTHYLGLTQTCGSAEVREIWNSNRATVLAKRADARIKEGERELAVGDIEAALQLEPSNPYALLLQGELT